MAFSFAPQLAFLAGPLEAISAGRQYVGEWNKNNQSPKLTVPATVVAKRSDVHRGIETMHTFTSYYVTFQVESGDRMEFEVSDMEYGMLAEGDSGELTFQGTRYLNFQRNESAE